MNHQGRGYVGLPEANTVAKHGATVGVQLRKETLRSLTLVGGILVFCGTEVKLAALAEGFMDQARAVDHQVL